MKYYAVLDTNVIVSAFLKKGSVPDTILRLALNKVIELFVNDKIVQEYHDVLLRKRFGFDKNDVEIFIEEVKRRAVFVDAQSLDEVFEDIGDKVFYEVVMDARTNVDAYLVTGNTKHFPVKPFVVTPREMLEIILKDIPDAPVGL